LAGAEHVRRQAVAGGILTGAGRDRAWCWPTRSEYWRWAVSHQVLVDRRPWLARAPSVQRRSVAGVVRIGAGLCRTRCWSIGGLGCAAPSVRRRAVAGGVATGAGRGQAWCWRSAALTDPETFSSPSCGGAESVSSLAPGLPRVSFFLLGAFDVAAGGGCLIECGQRGRGMRLPVADACLRSGQFCLSVMPAGERRTHGFSFLPPLGSLAADQRLIQPQGCKWLAEWLAPATGFYGPAMA
jgi:hypothetical protein